MGTTISSAALDNRQRKILFRCWHRGTREMDLVFGRFADNHIANLSESELDALEALMEFPDRDLFSWVSGEVLPPAEILTPLYAKIVAFTVQGN